MRVRVCHGQGEKRGAPGLECRRDLRLRRDLAHGHCHELFGRPGPASFFKGRAPVKASDFIAKFGLKIDLGSVSTSILLSWGCFWELLGDFGRPLGLPWATLGRSRGALGASWASPGAPRGPSGDPPGTLLGSLGLPGWIWKAFGLPKP